MSSNETVGFGSGVLWATPSGANQTPIQFGTLQDVSIDFNFSTKQLMGQFQMPIAVARGGGKITGKASFANIESDTVNRLFFNVTPAANQKRTIPFEPGSIPTTPFTITVANGATFDTDLGVQFVSNGVALRRVASAPAAGQYSVNTTTGVYTFAAADTGKAVLISYVHAPASGAVGFKSTITNQIMGIAPTFQIDLYQANPNIVGAQWSMRLYACMSNKLSFATKLEDFMIPEFAFEAFANASNLIGEFNAAA